MISKLNSEQQSAVMATEGYVRVIAGAGTGKTRTLAHRYAFLVNELGISPSNILCVTFTNKAATEMRNRVRRMVDMGNVNDLICTYHSFCIKVLRRDIVRLGYPESFVVMDESDAHHLLKECYEQLGIKRKDISYRSMLAYMALQKSELYPQYISMFLHSTDEALRQDFVALGDDSIEWRCFVRYLELQRGGFMLDFDDLIYFATYLLEHFEDVLNYWNGQLDYIMVDETQDNSQRQWQLVAMLQQLHRNLFVVGDPDQCIYEWRGAKPKSLVEFDQNFAPCTTIVLDRNYRSTPTILQAANSIIAHNRSRIEKNLYTERNAVADVVHHHAKNEKAEGEFIAQTIKQLNADGHSLSDMAVLYRSSFNSRFIEQALVEHALPYVVYGEVRFYERREVKDTIAYLRMVDSGDNLSFKRVINLPSRKLGRAFMERLEIVAEREQCSLYQALKGNLDDPKLNKRGAVEFVELIEGLRAQAKGLSISALTERLLELCGLMTLYRDDANEERVDNIKDLISSMRQYEQINVNEAEVSLTKYLQDIALYSNIDRNEGEGCVKIMTIHQAKGLEFDTVFVAGMNEGIFPNDRTIRERKREGLEEERRLAYVAYTRAKERLFLTESEGYSMQVRMDKLPSRFIYEAGEGVRHEGKMSREMERRIKAVMEYSNRELESLSQPTAPVKVGQVVHHCYFGQGIVEAVDESKSMLAVSFDNQPPRHFSFHAIGPILHTDF